MRISWGKVQDYGNTKIEIGSMIRQTIRIIIRLLRHFCTNIDHKAMELGVRNLTERTQANYKEEIEIA